MPPEKSSTSAISSAWAGSDETFRQASVTNQCPADTTYQRRVERPVVAQVFYFALNPKVYDGFHAGFVMANCTRKAHS